MGHPRPNDHHRGSSAKRFSSKSDLTPKHVGDVACITHPSGNILRVVSVVLVAATIKLALALISNHLSIRGPRGHGHVVWRVGSVQRTRGHATGYGTAAVARSASDAAGDVENRGETGGTDDGTWGTRERQWPGRRGRHHCGVANIP